MVLVSEVVSIIFQRIRARRRARAHTANAGGTVQNKASSRRDASSQNTERDASPERVWFFLSATMPMMCGGTSDVKEADAKIQQICDEVSRETKRRLLRFCPA